MANSRTCVYRAFIGMELAYVGVTRNPLGRFANHRSRKPWWAKVDHVNLEWFGNRAEALRAELQAISSEEPIYNVARPLAVPHG